MYISSGFKAVSKFSLSAVKYTSYALGISLSFFKYSESIESSESLVDEENLMSTAQFWQF